MKFSTAFLIIILQLIAHGKAYSEITKAFTLEKKGNQNFTASGEIISGRSVPGDKNKFIISLGLGGGISLINYQEYASTFGDNYLRPCFSSNFRIGYAPSDKFFVCWNARTNIFKHQTDTEYSENFWLAGGGAGLGATFFPFDNQPSLYLNCLFGYSNLFEGFKLDVNNFGTEIGFGVGYVLKNNISAECNFQLGTSDKSQHYGTLKNPVIFNLTVNYILWKK